MYSIPRKTIRTIDDAGRTEIARRIWGSTRPAAGTPVEDYLRGRGITILPPSIRYATLQHPSGSVHQVMIAAVLGPSIEITGIHRTFLSDPKLGPVTKANVDPNKMSLGPIRGCAVRFGPTPDPAGLQLIITEGVEDALSISQALPEVAVWAALGVSNLHQLTIPTGIREVVIAADNDPVGKRAALKAASAYQRAGHVVRIAYPSSGKDFNEVLRA